MNAICMLFVMYQGLLKSSYCISEEFLLYKYNTLFLLLFNSLTDALYCKTLELQRIAESYCLLTKVFMHSMLKI